LERCCILIVLLTLCTSSFAYKSTLLTPSKNSLIRQNVCANQLNLERIQNLSRVAELAEQGVLSPLLVGRTLSISPTLPKDRRYVLPMVNTFLLTLSEQYYIRFGKPLVITSAVRPVETQERLRKHNRNAAPAEGETASSHEVGSTVDIGKHGMSRAQLQWMRSVLSYEVAMNHAIVEEEHKQACFHTMVLGGD